MTSATIAILADGTMGLVVSKATKEGQIVRVETRNDEPTWAIVGETVSENCTTKVVRAVPAAERAMMDIVGKAHKRRGVVVYQSKRVGHHALVCAGKSITIFGSAMRYRAWNGMTEARECYVCEFKIGDIAVYSGFNKLYTGEIIAIGPNTVSIKESWGTKVHRMSIESFSSWNEFYDAEYIAKRNSEWTD